MKVEMSWARVLGGAKEAMSHSTLEECVCGGPCLEELCTQEGSWDHAALAATGLVAQLAGRGNATTDESTGLEKNFHPVVLKALNVVVVVWLLSCV